MMQSEVPRTPYRVRLLLLQHDDPQEGAVFALERPLFVYAHESNSLAKPFIDFVVGGAGQSLAVSLGLFPVG